MKLGSLRNQSLPPLPPHCVLEQCNSHKDPFKSFSADVLQHQNSSESSAWKAQFRKHSNSSEKVHLSFERENVLLSEILVICVICNFPGL